MKKLFLLFIVLSFSRANAQDNYGFYDFEQIEASSPLKERMQDFLCQLAQHLDDSLRKMETALVRKYEGFREDPVMDSLQRFRCESELVQLNLDLSSFQSGAVHIYEQYVQQLRNEFHEKVRKSAAQFCKEKGVFFLAEKGSILYCPDCCDYTSELADYIREQWQKY
jgi:Skp family chaperone for outer membrane proteins